MDISFFIRPFLYSLCVYSPYDLYFLPALDPYVSLECEGVTVSTVVKKDTESAKYEDGAVFYVKKPQDSMLKIKVRSLFCIFLCVRPE